MVSLILVSKLDSLIVQLTAVVRALAAQILRRQARLVVLQHPDDLFYAEPAALHHPPSMERALTSKRGHFRGARQPTATTSWRSEYGRTSRTSALT